jgi:hypothetical protein
MSCSQLSAICRASVFGVRSNLPIMLAGPLTPVTMDRQRLYRIVNTNCLVGARAQLGYACNVGQPMRCQALGKWQAFQAYSTPALDFAKARYTRAVWLGLNYNWAWAAVNLWQVHSPCSSARPYSMSSCCSTLQPSCIHKAKQPAMGYAQHHLQHHLRKEDTPLLDLRSCQTTCSNLSEASAQLEA